MAILHKAYGEAVTDINSEHVKLVQSLDADSDVLSDLDVIVGNANKELPRIRNEQIKAFGAFIVSKLVLTGCTTLQIASKWNRFITKFFPYCLSKLGLVDMLKMKITTEMNAYADPEKVN